MRVSSDFRQLLQVLWQKYKKKALDVF